MLVNLLGFVIRLRYRVVVEGLEDLKNNLKERRGILFLPNHVATIDPVLLMQAAWNQFQLRPVVVDDYFYGKGLHFIMKLVRALPCPNMDYGVNPWKLKQLNKLENQVVEGLKQGDNYLIYPSGKLKVTEHEIIGGASFVPHILEKVPDAKVVFVRTVGLWGSRFSAALTGRAPNFAKNLLESLKVLLKNGIFFAPRRTVKIQFALAPNDFPHSGDRHQINHYLENWYNASPDPLTRVSYAFWKEELLPIASPAERKTPPSTIKIAENVRTDIYEKISEIAQIPKESITFDKQLVRDLGLDSLDVAQLTFFLEEKYHVGQMQFDFAATIGDLLQVIATKQTTQEETVTSSSTLDKQNPIHEETNRLPPQLPQGAHLLESFFLACDRQPSAIACMDATTGPLSYRKLKTAVLVLANEIRDMPGKNIGIMLPSSVGGYITILASLCAGKVPVMLNWTVGARSINHAIATAKLETVLSSLRFLNRLRNVELGEAEDKIILLEDVKRNIGLKKKLGAYLRSYSSSSNLLEQLGLKIQPSDPAVILFTSGTETLPKGVPLSHENILSNQRAAMSVVELKSSDFLYGILPPFHSFGFSVTGLFPLLAGLKVFYAPDPTNHKGMVKDIATYKCTFFCSAPTFIRNLFHAASPEDLQSLRLIVTGAEKAGKELFEYVKTNLKQAVLLEGYGITECSPIVTLCRPHVSKPVPGVGEPVPGVELLIVDPQNDEECVEGMEGEVCIAGPNVFKGYLGGMKNPFLDKKGKRWYRSGDRGYLTPEGDLVLSGRLKRFVKIGGEMISLGGLEEEIAQIAEQEGWVSLNPDAAAGPRFALCAIEKEGIKTALALYTTHAIDKETLNGFLKRRGHSNLMRISEVHTIEQIPLTGTGKTNYRLLEEISEKS